MTTIKESGPNDKDTDEEDLSFTEPVLPTDEPRSSFLPPPSKSDDAEDHDRSINSLLQTKPAEQDDLLHQTSPSESAVHMTETTQKVIHH